MLTRHRSLTFAYAVASVLSLADSASAQAQLLLDTETLARGLESVWSLAFAQDGRLFLAERPGRIRVIQRGSLVAEPWAVIPAHESAAQGNESGLMGLAIDPAFGQNGRVYVCYTQSTGQAIVNRIAVLTESAGKGGQPSVLVDGIPAGRYHNGCRLKFGPDGKLYATTGDAGESRDQGGRAQDPASLAGKVLRLNPDGSVPVDNPTPGSLVWSSGHRNVQGLAFHPETGALYATEHGTGAGGNNELNRIERGRNYGWPVTIGNERDARFVPPLFVGPDAPAGATFVAGDRYPGLRGSLLIGAIGTRRLLRLTLSDDLARAPTTEVLIDQTLGRIRDVVQGPDGLLYLGTSNRDGRGTPSAEDDRVIRLQPRP
jgi:glucose/arabinose dehydrogenase